MQNNTWTSDFKLVIFWIEIRSDTMQGLQDNIKQVKEKSNMAALPLTPSVNYKSSFRR